MKKLSRKEMKNLVGGDAPAPVTGCTRKCQMPESQGLHKYIIVVPNCGPTNDPLNGGCQHGDTEIACVCTTVVFD